MALKMIGKKTKATISNSRFKPKNQRSLRGPFFLSDLNRLKMEKAVQVLRADNQQTISFYVVEGYV